MPRVARAAVLVSMVLWAAAAAPGVAAHVNWTVGPYAILVILVEEPVYQDNHAGFEFWVRRDGVAITGLERTVSAIATGHGETVDLVISPADASGFYVADQTADGRAFDPIGGGAWTLVLSGSIDGTPVETSFPVTFPSYPRVGVAVGPTTAGAEVTAVSSAGGWPAWLIALTTTGLVGAIAFTALAVRRRPRRPEGPDLTT